jgi:hypothetical protein
MLKKLTFLVIILLAFLHVSAQETKVVRDLRLWTGAKIQKTFAKDWTISLEEEIRFKNNISEINNFFTEVGLRYRINKNFALGGGFRYTQDKTEANTYQGYSRYNFDLRYKGKIDFVTIYYRARYQKEVEGWEFYKMDVPYEKYFRNRIGVRINSLKWIEPYVTAEIFQLFTPTSIPEFHYYRIVAGVGYEPGNFGEFKVAWGFNRELSSAQPAMIYMFRVNYTYAF